MYSNHLYCLFYFDSFSDCVYLLPATGISFQSEPWIYIPIHYMHAARGATRV